jgi:D-arabinose 1-dehydrogenase-like Zn-dependent alcohol dehydrogenase
VLSWAAGALAPGGRLVLLTTFRTTSMRIQPRSLVLGEQTVVGSKYASRAELAVAADLVASRRVTPIIGQHAGPGEVLEIHEALRSGALVGRGALRW